MRWIATGHYPQTADAYRAKLAPNTFSIRSAYAPSKDAIEWSRAVLDAAEGERGAFRFRGQMIDEPVLRHARSVLQRVG
ncbi:MAG: hypothetical protein WBA87_13985 [Microbacterium sp.]